MASTQSELRIPRDEEAERAVLGAVMVDNTLIATAIDVLDPGDFFLDAHRAIFGAIRTLAGAGQPAELFHVKHELARTGRLEQAGGAAYLAGLLDGVHRSMNVEHYAAEVRNTALIRDVLVRAQAIVRDCLESGERGEVIRDRAEQAMFEVGQRSARGGLEPFLVAVREALDLMERLRTGPTGGLGVRFGLTDLDNQTGGMGINDVIILAGRTSMGKTALSLHVAASVVETGKTVGYFSLEMGRDQLAFRTFAAKSGVNLQGMRNGLATDRDWQKIAEVGPELAAWPWYVDHSPSTGLLEMRTRARRLKAEHGLDLIVVDYLQLMRGPQSENRQTEVAAISRGLKALAKDLHVPVLALAQLSREAEKRADKRPQLADLRESGAIEMDADVVLLLYRPALYDKKADDRELEINVAKQRNGPIGVVMARFEKETQRFGDDIPNYPQTEDRRYGN